MAKPKATPQPALASAKPDSNKELQTRLEATRSRRQALQCRPYKNADHQLMLAALDIQIGSILLQLNADRT